MDRSRKWAGSVIFLGKRFCPGRRGGKCQFTYEKENRLDPPMGDGRTGRDYTSQDEKGWQLVPDSRPLLVDWAFLG